MSIGNRMRGLGESVYYLDDLKPKMDELMGDVSYELNHEVGKRKLLVRLDGFGEEYKPQIETLMDEELPVGYRMEYDPFPLDYTKIEFLESTGTQYITTSIQPSNFTGAYVKGLFTDFYSDWGQPCIFGTMSNNKRFVPLCYSRENNKIVFEYGGNSLISSGTSIGLGELVETYLNYQNNQKYEVITSSERKQIGLGSANFSISAPLLFFASHHFTDSRIFCKPKGAKLYFSEVTDRDALVAKFVPSLDPTGTPCLFDTVTRKPFRNNGSGQFIVGLTMKQALNLAKLPATGGSLTISLPKEATLVQHNQQVEAALNTAAEKGWNIPVQYRGAGEEKEIINKYAECKTVNDVLAVNADYKNDLTDEGEWIYPLSSITYIDSLAFDRESALKKFNAHVNNACTFGNCFNGAPVEVITFRDYVAPYNFHRVMWGTEKLREVNIDMSQVTKPSTLCYASYALTTINSDFTSLNTTDWAFMHGAILNKETTLRILNTIPAWSDGATHSLNLHSHVDNKTDEDVIAAIAAAEEKGWTVAMTWNGTPTNSATYGLRRQNIYAKVETL